MAHGLWSGHLWAVVFLVGISTNGSLKPEATPTAECRMGVYFTQRVSQFKVVIQSECRAKVKQDWINCCLLWTHETFLKASLLVSFGTMVIAVAIVECAMHHFVMQTN